MTASKAFSVDVWRIELGAAVGDSAPFAATLDEAEHLRARRYLNPEHGRRFTIARGALRMILARYLEIAPSAVRFRYQPLGRPELDHGATPEWDFNLSHSGQRALLALSRCGPLGIDVEQRRERESLGELARRFFAPAEVAAWESLPAELQVAGFYAAWTRKEAYLKARGSGLTAPLDRFTVALDPRLPAALLAVDDDPAELSRHQLVDLTEDEEYSAALIAPAGELAIQRRTFILQQV